MSQCKTIGCPGHATIHGDFCPDCADQRNTENTKPSELSENLSEKYPQYYKPVGDLTEVDVYAVHMLFAINDPSGCIHHSSKKLLLAGVRTGGKPAYEDIKEARDTLTRWLQLHDRRI